VARFANHSCDANCLVEKWTVAGRTCMALVTRRHVAPGARLGPLGPPWPCTECLACCLPPCPPSPHGSRSCPQGLQLPCMWPGCQEPAWRCEPPGLASPDPRRAAPPPPPPLPLPPPPLPRRRGA
jgi:hypothetical protein